MSKPIYAAYKAADPYFNLVRRALGDLVDGEHFFDIVTDDTIYEVHGTVLATGAKYNNRFHSIIHLENRKIAHWRDYMDSHAAWNALTPRSR